MKLEVDGQTVKVQLGYDIELELERAPDPYVPQHTSWRAVAISAPGARLAIGAVVPPGELRDELERSHMVYSAPKTGRAAQIERTMAEMEDERRQLPAITTGPDMFIYVTACPKCGANGTTDFKQCVRCGVETTSGAYEVHGAATFAKIGYSERELKMMRDAITRDGRFTVNLGTKGIDLDSATSVLLYCAMAGGHDIARGRVEKRPQFVRFFVDATEGVGVL